MKKYVYPAIIYYDDECDIYVLIIEELRICVEGDSIEEVHAKGGQFLKIYIDEAIKESIDIQEPRNFKEVAEENAKQICMLVEYNCE